MRPRHPRLLLLRTGMDPRHDAARPVRPLAVQQSIATDAHPVAQVRAPVASIAIPLLNRKRKTGAENGIFAVVISPHSAGICARQPQPKR